MSQLVTRCKCLLIFGLWLIASFCSAAEQKPTRPNILFILADDLGFADLGSYGSEIATPNLDRLARNGLRYTQFYNTARCWPTRAALLSGYYPQQVRMDPPIGPLPAWSPLLPLRLKKAGYRSYHSGKWHIQGAPKVLKDGGFDRSYRLEDHNRNFNPNSHLVDDVPQPAVPKGSNYYTTVAVADFMIECLKQHASSNASHPFFAYLAFTAPHFPLQALPQDIAKYRGKYSEGWDVVRQQRYERQKRIGLIDCSLSPLEPEIVPHWNMTDAAIKAEIGPGEVARAIPWSELNSEERAFQAEKMAIHAAMIDRMDQEIGRVLKQLEAMGQLDNTIVMFASDNGTSAEFLNRGDKHDLKATPGSAESFLCLGSGWSSVGNTPFRLHKSWVHEGGISTPFIVHWPKGVTARGELRHTPGHIIDFVPTMLELTGLDKEVQTPALPGRSLVPTFAGETDLKREYLFFHHEHNRALRIGDWKLVSKRPNTNDFELYQVSRDRAEQVNLAGREKERAEEMAKMWKKIENEFRQTASLGK